MIDISLITVAVPVFFSIIAHEIAHGYAAAKLGDDTAKRCGRLSLNPIYHIDPLGTIVLPMILWFSGAHFLFGWAKPVPVNFSRLHHPYRDTVIVASAGIMVNAVLMMIAVLALKISSWPNFVIELLFNLAMINFALIALNILPFPPLDGSKIFFGWINRPWAHRYVAAEREGMLAIIALLVLLPSFTNINPLGWYMSKMFQVFLGG